MWVSMAELQGLRPESGWPFPRRNRLFVISKEGLLVDVGEQGPWGFWPSERITPYGWGEDHDFDHGQPLEPFLESFLGDSANC